MPYSDPAERAEYQKLWMRKRRASFLDGKSCVQCGSTDKLEVDHEDPTQKVTHNVWSWKAERRNAELAKCQILCRPCHKRKSTPFWREQGRALISKNGRDAKGRIRPSEASHV